MDMATNAGYSHSYKHYILELEYGMDFIGSLTEAFPVEPINSV